VERGATVYVCAVGSSHAIDPRSLRKLEKLQKELMVENVAY
jgi:hypothetical protein